MTDPLLCQWCSHCLTDSTTTRIQHEHAQYLTPVLLGSIHLVCMELDPNDILTSLNCA